MGTSPLVHTERASTEPKGRDMRSLGPSDSSDSGSDLAGVDRLDVNDPTQPVDVALGDDEQRSPIASRRIDGAAATDTGGTGERRAAAGDAGERAGADLRPDRVLGADGKELDDDEDPDLDFMDDAEEAPPPDEDKRART